MSARPLLSFLRDYTEAAEDDKKRNEAIRKELQSSRQFFRPRRRR